ncbi:MAG: hypothetical protein HDQ96_13985 [Lachnospiraceae bacterium]|nr:hypothetical protein [Lachnospiraceae bacterium]
MLNSKTEMITMKNRLKAILDQGIELYLDGKPASPDGIVERFVREEAVYMPDFVIDEDGTLIQIRYDKIMETN